MENVEHFFHQTEESIKKKLSLRRRDLCHTKLADARRTSCVLFSFPNEGLFYQTITIGSTYVAGNHSDGISDHAPGSRQPSRERDAGGDGSRRR